jgi:tetraacyldisaccharide 4'-kinase
VNVADFVRDRLERWLNGVWYEGRPGAAILAPLSALFGAASAIRRAAYRRRLLRSHRPAVPVVVVGNLSVGGTGKTPLTAWLARQLADRGIVAGVLLRGYGSAAGSARRAIAGADPREVGDEAALLAAEVPGPVVVAADRAAGTRLLEAQGAQLIVCDDGLQHYALQRDLEIVVVDGRRGLGNGRLLPAGPLREGVGRLDEVDYVVTHVAAGAAAPARPPGPSAAPRGLCMTLRAEDARSLQGAVRRRRLQEFGGGPVHAVAGIGNPARFFDMLQAAGIDVIRHPFPDHHDFEPSDLEFADARPILMTAKDAVKCRAFADARMWEVPVSAELSPDGGRALVAHVAALVPTLTG